MQHLAPQVDKPQYLLHGLDTVQCAYFFSTSCAHAVDFEWLYTEREALRLSKSREPKPIHLGDMEVLLHGYGSSSGYSFVVSNADFKIEFGEYNKPSFFVTFRSEALWRETAYALHEKILAWADSVGLVPVQSESLSRVDFCFDYHLPEVDFDEDSFVSRSAKDSQHRYRGDVQTFTFGKGDVVLRVYDKVAEIAEQSGKVWFFDLWGRKDEVWRVEWQVRRPILKRFGIRTFEDLRAQEGDVLHYLATEHDTLRVPTDDSNRSRWPLHTLWQDIQARIDELTHLGVYQVEGESVFVDEQLARLLISVNGYAKRYAALQCRCSGTHTMRQDKALEQLSKQLAEIEDPFTWRVDVEKKVTEMRLGKW